MDRDDSVEEGTTPALHLGEQEDPCATQAPSGLQFIDALRYKKEEQQVSEVPGVGKGLWHRMHVPRVCVHACNGELQREGGLPIYAKMKKMTVIKANTCTVMSRSAGGVNACGLNTGDANCAAPKRFCGSCSVNSSRFTTINGIKLGKGVSKWDTERAYVASGCNGQIVSQWDIQTSEVQAARLGEQ